MGSGTEQLAGCVLWHATGDDPAPELLGALARKRIAVACASDRYMALAEACRLRDRGGVVVVLLHEPDRLMAEHSRTMVAELLEAVAMYVPASTLWAYDATRSPELHAFDDRDIVPEFGISPEARRGSDTGDAPRAPGAWGAAPSAQLRDRQRDRQRDQHRDRAGERRDAPPGVPDLRLVEAPDDAPAPPPHTDPLGDPLGPAGERPGGDPPELTEEELAALLGLDAPRTTPADREPPDPKRGLGGR